MKIKEILTEDIEFISNPQTLQQLLTDVQREMEEIDDASMGSEEGDANYAGLSRDYSALLAVENVIKNHLKALKNNLMDSNIFMYDNYDYAGEIAAIHVALEDTVAHVKWLGSYNGQGGQLYRAAIQEAKRRGATSVEVEAKWNSDGFYRKMGLDTAKQGEYNPFTDSQLNKMAGPLEEETLTELVGIKNKIKNLPKNPMSIEDFPVGMEWHHALYTNGFRPLGSGTFGTVWEHPKLSYVLKVFTSDDIVYSEWITTARQHKNNPHMPQFISPRLMRVAPGVMAIRTERLTQIDQKVNAMLPAIDVLVETATIDKRDPSEIIATALSGSGLSSRFTPLLDYCKVYTEFLPALDIVCKFARRPGFRPDIHDENIMMRGPVIVFTDPAFDRTALMNKQL